MLDDDDQLSMIAFNYGSDIGVSVHSTAVAKISLLHVELDFKELKNAVSGEEYAPTPVICKTRTFCKTRT